ncbi:hypothetical protein KAF25_009191 [Fusarium avenaceum]|uniref:SET domain-containing protein n=1 Tax=Fusarium avenaceum TaxID=40199 RepID=A0A9P7GZK0_9HYPO|nr:hypothetical protein KAF25_009191 [Fusarium avenaceum]
MDVIDASRDPNFHAMLKEIRNDAIKASEKTGRLVTDHPEAKTLTDRFFAKLMGKSILTPSLSPFGKIVEGIIGDSNPFPNVKMVDDHFNVPPITKVIKPYPPCILSEKDLEFIKISEMRLQRCHRGKKVLLHLISPPDRNDAVMAIAKDEEGTAILLQMYQQPSEKLVPSIQNILNYTFCIVKEPIFMQSFDSTFNSPLQFRSAYYSLRIDHPGDIIGLTEGDERIPEKWRGEARSENESSLGYRQDGNACFRRMEFMMAQRSYSSALDTAETLLEKQLAYLNRSIANLKLDRPAKALLDVTHAYDPAKPTEKPMLRHANVLYDMGKFEECEATLQTCLEAFPKCQAARTKLLSVKARLQEQSTGKYDFKDMYEQAKARTPPLIECATFSTPIKIRDSPGRGRGLFTTKAVSAGDLLLCEKAFSYSFIDDTRLEDDVTCMLNLSTKRVTLGASADLWPQVVHKLYHDPESLSAFQELYHGDYKKTAVSECDGNPIIDVFLVEKILSLNSFGCPRTSHDFCKNNVWSGKEGASTRERPLFTSAGIWLTAARINHSCVGNCRRSFIGDIQIVRAARDMPAGTELLFPYRPSGSSEPYQRVQQELAKWAFTCACEMCKDRGKTSDAVVKQRRDLKRDFMNQLPGDEPFDLPKAMRLMKGVEKTYRGKPAKQIRWVLAEVYAYIGIRARQEGYFVDATKMLIKALEAHGFVIYATDPGAVTAEPRFEVKHWGMMEHVIPWLFFQLIECYDQVNMALVPVVAHYAEVTYSVIVGEKISIWEVMPSTGNKQ